ncbi:MAG: hypothetical protein IPP33_09715 [Flavobacteriales bacterium]|nr:hypothetical protein [Flavobacteriales bacterium]
MGKRKAHGCDGTSPLLLYGYGSCRIDMEPTFSSARLSLLDRGLRVRSCAYTGESVGRAWYDNGKMEHKQNTPLGLRVIVRSFC